MKFLIKAPTRLAELAVRERILLDILHLAETNGVQFAFPTQTLHIESVPVERPTVGGPGNRNTPDDAHP